MSLLIIELVLCVVFALLLYQCCAKRATAGDDDADDLESFRQRMGSTRESQAEDNNSPEAVAARKELIDKNLFSRKIQREESVKELAQLLAISRGRGVTETDEEMGGCAPSSNETSKNSSAPIKGEDNFSLEEVPLGGDDVVPTPSAPPLVTQTDNIASAIYTPANRNSSIEQRPQTGATAISETTATTVPEGGFIRNLWKGLTHIDQPPHQSQESATTPQCQLHQHKLECSICLDEYKPNDTISWAKDGGDAPSAYSGATASGCDHIFHHGCLESWLEHHDDCPLCRRKLVHEDADVRFSDWDGQN